MSSREEQTGVGPGTGRQTHEKTGLVELRLRSDGQERASVQKEGVDRTVRQGRMELVVGSRGSELWRVTPL